MVDKTRKTKRKRLAKGKRAHVRRLKQAARMAGVTPGLPTSLLSLSREPKKQVNP